MTKIFKLILKYYYIFFYKYFTTSDTSIFCAGIQFVQEDSPIIFKVVWVNQTKHRVYYKILKS